ncbi:hypothetical protein VTH06DRAFT_6659 [Thermothelomyces fergusii]
MGPLFNGSPRRLLSFACFILFVSGRESSKRTPAKLTLANQAPPPPFSDELIAQSSATPRSRCRSARLSSLAKPTLAPSFLYLSSDTKEVFHDRYRQGEGKERGSHEEGARNGKKSRVVKGSRGKVLGTYLLLPIRLSFYSLCLEQRETRKRKTQEGEKREKEIAPQHNLTLRLSSARCLLSIVRSLTPSRDTYHLGSASVEIVSARHHLSRFSLAAARIVR